MTNISATTPRNRWGIKIPSAAYGAAQLPIPQPVSLGEANSVEFAQKLRDAERAQIQANAEAAKAARQSEFAQPYRAPGASASSPADVTEPTDGQFEAGASAAREALTLSSVSYAETAARHDARLRPAATAVSAVQPSPDQARADYARGAAAAREALAACGQSPPAPDHDHRTLAAPVGDQARAAEEARALLKLAGW